MVEIYVGTCGWLYNWNEGGTLDWYVGESGLNAVELNASFYRFPYKNQVKGWAKKGSGLRWAVKVHRRVTHVHKFAGEALDYWNKFVELFEPMDALIDFYLFQLPPSYKCDEEGLRRIEGFLEHVRDKRKVAVEFRNAGCFNDRIAKWGEDNGIVIVSVDSPIGVWITSTRGIVYLRMHGRTEWYGHEYTEDEMREDAKKIAALSPQKVYVFFNNDVWMLENARYMKRLLEEIMAK